MSATKTTLRRAHLLSLIVFSLFLAFLAVTSVFAAGRSLGAMKPPAANPAPLSPDHSDQDPPYAPEAVIVGLQPGASLAHILDSLAAAYQSELLTPGGDQRWLDQSGERGSAVVLDWRALAPAPTRKLATVDRPASPMEQVYRLRLKPGLDPLQAIATLQQDPQVEFAEPDYLAQAITVPNDPDYAQQWGLDKINAPTAWDQSTGDSQTVIAIIDSGLDLTHEDLASQIWANPEESLNGVDDDDNGKVDDLHGWNFLEGNNDVSDDYGHGTQVAGVAAAASNNALGIAGTCWNCKIMPVKVMQTSGVVNYSDVATAVAYAASEGAQVINLSLGGYADSEALRLAIESAATTAVIVAGAGNDDTQALFYPAAYQQVIAAGSSDSSDLKASFSNYGTWLDLLAPGVAITTTYAGANSYGAEDGTSLSAPFIAGAAGLLVSQNSDWSSTLIKQHLLLTAFDVEALNPGYTTLLGHGRLDMGAALTTLPQPQMSLLGYALDGLEEARPEPGGSYQLSLTLLNEWLPARDLTAVLSESDPYLTISDAQGSFGALDTGQSATNLANPYGFSLSGETPYSHVLQFHLQLSGADGYSLGLDFQITVRSALELIGNPSTTTTLYSSQTWTNDKTYRLLGNVVVYKDATLTIQPGTRVEVAPEKWLRIDGGLIASGSALQPITFTTSDPEHAWWAGLRFTDTSLPAEFDVQGEYLSGSLLRHVNLSYAQTGVSIVSKSPYITDCLFEFNGNSYDSAMVEYGLAINSGSSAARIENNTFRSNGSGISFGSGGRPYIFNNRFEGHQYEGVIYGDGEPLLISNTLQNNATNAINLWGWSGFKPVIHGNRIINNAGGIYLNYSSGADIKHNLIAGNGAGIFIDVSQQNLSSLPVHLAYNPQQLGYLLLWAESGPPIGYSYSLQRLNAEGEPEGASTWLGNFHGGDLVYNPTQDEYLAAWLLPDPVYPYSGTSNLQVQRISSSGIPSGAPVTVGGLEEYNQLAVIYQPVSNNYLLVYREVSTSPNRLFAQRLGLDGAPQGTPVQLGTNLESPSLADLAYDPVRQGALIVIRGQQNTPFGCGNECLFGAWLAQTSEGDLPAYAMVRDTNSNNPTSARLAYGASAGGYLLAWSADTSLFSRVITDTASFSSITTWDDPRLLTYSEIYTSTYPYQQLDLLYDAAQENFMLMDAINSEALCEDMLGLRISPSGSLVTEPIQVFAPPDTCIGLGSPRLGLDETSNRYLALWQSWDMDSGEIRGQQFAPDGSLLDASWTPEDERDPAITFKLSMNNLIRDNTIIHNRDVGLSIGGDGAGEVLIEANNWFGNRDYDLYNWAPAGIQVNAANNYWGEIDPAQIPDRIYDCYDTPDGCGTTQLEVISAPSLEAPSQSAPAYLRRAQVNPDPVGIQRGLFELEFSRPMITSSLPSLSFHDARRGTSEAIAAVSGWASAIEVDQAGRVWVGTHISSESSDAQGAWRFDGREWQNFNTGNSGLADDNVHSILAAPDGSMWFGHNWTISRLKDSQWTTFSETETGFWFGGIRAIQADNLGRIWFQTDSGTGLLVFDGSAWQRLTTENGLPDNYITGLTSDSQGRIWITGSFGVAVRDGATWTTYTMAQGLPTNEIRAVFGDSQGRAWAVFGYNEDNIYLGVIQDGLWTFFTPTNTDGVLDCELGIGIAEDSLSNIYFNNGCSGLVKYDGSVWTRTPITTNDWWSTNLHFDPLNNLWMTESGRLQVLWGGEDFAVVDGAQWLDATHFQASYDFTPLVPQAIYAISASGAQGLDGMQIAPDEHDRFEVAYAGYVSDDTPPATPLVLAASDGSLSTLNLSWTSYDPEGLAQFRYALGTTPGGREVLDWKYVPASTTEIKLNGLLLIEGQVYYGSVQAQNLSGLWSQVGISNPLAAGVVTNPSRVYLPLAPK